MTVEGYRAGTAARANPRANSMICWVLEHRSPWMIDSRKVRRGHWLWDSIHHEITGAWPDDGAEEEQA